MSATRRSGNRPALAPLNRGKVYTAQEVADVLGVSLKRVVWHCEAAVRAGDASFFDGAWMDEKDGWLIPERALRRALGSVVHQHYKISEVALLTGFSERMIRSRVKIVAAGLSLEEGRPEHMLGGRLFFGTDLRVSGLELDRLAEGLVTGLPEEYAGEGGAK